MFSARIFALISLIVLSCVAADCGGYDEEACCACLQAEQCVMPTSGGFFLCNDRYIQDCPGLPLCTAVCGEL